MSTPTKTVYNDTEVELALRDDVQASYRPLLGLSLRDLQFNQQPLRLPGARQSGRWQAFLKENTAASLFIRGDGIFVSGTHNNSLKRALLDGAGCDGRVLVPGLGRFSGLFMLTRLRYLGAENELMRWQFDLTSNGDVSFATL